MTSPSNPASTKMPMRPGWWWMSDSNTSLGHRAVEVFESGGELFARGPHYTATPVEDHQGLWRTEILPAGVCEALWRYAEALAAIRSSRPGSFEDSKWHEANAALGALNTVLRVELDSAETGELAITEDVST